MAGFAAYVFEGEDPVLMNFEDPDDMEKHQQWLDEEMKRRSEVESTTNSGSSAAETPSQAQQQPKDAFRR